MNLFSTNIDENILPFDGESTYYGSVLNTQLASHYFDKLMRTIEWKHDEVVMFGKRITTKRKVAWFGDEKFSYTYSKITKTASLWTPELLELKNIVEKASDEKYNSCLLNLYHSGEEGMGYHTDDEKMLKKNAAIASLSLGAARKFCFKHKETKKRIDVFLETGSLLVMKGETQKNWYHALPPTKKVKTPRINLTFRTIA